MSDTNPRTKMFCIVFSDIVGSTVRAEAARRAGYEEDYMRCLCLFREFWEQNLRRHNAQFIKGTGDGVLATFADVATAFRAVTAIRQTLDSHVDLQHFPVRIGMHVGAVGTDAGGDLVGMEVNRAERVMSQGGEGHVLLSDACAALLRPHLPPEYSLHDLGERPLKGFDAHMRLYQLRAPWLVETVPDSWHTRLQSRLPILTDPFIGREQDRKKLHGYLADPVRRCVSLIGSPGAGKTRLALQVAQDAQNDFPDGVLFVPLEETSSPAAVLSRIASALSVNLSPSADALHVLQNTLSGRRILLILDNFEQALAARDALVKLLESVPHLHLLVTSREPLRVRGERIYDLDPLTPPPENATLSVLRRCESVRLFVERAKAKNSHFKLTAANAADVAALCRAVSGLPLALEILAAETRYVPLQRLRLESAAMLDYGSERTLRATFDLSYQRLNESERMLFAQLGLFETAFSEEDVYDVCTGSDLGSGLRILCEKKLICFDTNVEGRPYGLLIPLREFARACPGDPKGAVRQRFIATFTRRAQALRADLSNYAELQAMQGVQANLEHLRKAWDFACTDGLQEAILELGTAVTPFAPLLPHSAGLASWVDVLERALKQAGGNARYLGDLYNTKARLAARDDKYLDAVKHQEQALQYFVQTEIPACLTDAYSTLAMFYLHINGFEKAQRYAQLAIELSKDINDAKSEAVGCFVLANVYRREKIEEAAVMADRSMKLFQDVGERSGIIQAHLALASIAEERADLLTAYQQYQNALELCCQIRSEVHITRCLERIGKFHGKHGNHEFANYLLLAASQGQQMLGIRETARLSLPAEISYSLSAEPPSLERAVERVLSAPLAMP